MTLTNCEALSVFLLLGQFIKDVLGSDYCYSSSGVLEYCQWSCCGNRDSQYCCMSPYTIAGIVFGVIAFICTIVAIVFCICQYKKQKSQVVAQRIFVVNGHNSQPTGYSPAYPLSPGYSPHYGMYNVPPPSYNSFNSHSKQPVAPPPYNHPASTAPLPPPPAYSPPPQNPFAKAAAEANASRH